MALIAYLVALAVVVFSWYQKRYYLRNKLLSKIPTIPSYPLIGSSLSLTGRSAAEMFQVLQKAARDYGTLWRFDLSPFHSNIIVSDPKICEGILSSQKLLEKSVEYEFVQKWLNDGLLLSTGKKWHQRRRIITPTFHFKILEQFVDVMEKQGQVFVAKLKTLEGQHFDFFPQISLYALDVICESAMGCKINAQIDSNSEYVKAVKEITNILFLRMFDSLKRIDFIYRFTGMYHREIKALKVLHEFTDSVIATRRHELANSIKTESGGNENEFGIKTKTAFLDLLLQSTIDGESLSNEDIREEVDTFMFEGHDTTTSGIAFVLYNLAKHPEIQQKVFNEARHELGDDPEKTVTMQQLNNLSYLELVIKESLRLYPSVPFYGRKVHENLTIGDVTIPEGTSVNISPFFIGRDPKIFPDPLKFDPSRFEVELNNEKNNPYAYVPFSAGPRNCIGQKFAMLELKSAASKIIRNFELSITKENEELVLLSELILRPENGIVLCAKQRIY